MALNKELLEEKNNIYNKKMVEAQGKVTILQFDLTALDEDFESLNTLEKGISEQCTEERKEKEKLQVAIKELKENHLMELEKARRVQSPIGAKAT